MLEVTASQEVMEHARMWLPITLWLLGGAGAAIASMAVVILRLYKKCQLQENQDLRQAILNLNKTLGNALDRFDRRFELGKQEFARQRKVLRAHMIFMLAVCESARVKITDLDCKKIMETLEELDEYDAGL